MTTQLGACASRGDLKAVEHLINKGVILNCLGCWSPLSWACRYGHLEVVKLLLESGAKMEPDGIGDSPLHLAAGNGHTEVVKFLIHSGAKVTWLNSRKYSPLHEASWGGYETTIKTLILYGADIHLRGENGCSALDLAVQEEHTQAIAVLLAAGAECDQFQLLHILKKRCNDQDLSCLFKRRLYRLKTLCTQAILKHFNAFELKEITGNVIDIASCLWDSGTL